MIILDSVWLGVGWVFGRFARSVHSLSTYGMCLYVYIHIYLYTGLRVCGYLNWICCFLLFAVRSAVVQGEKKPDDVKRCSLASALDVE